MVFSGATYVWVLTNRKPEHRQGKVFRRIETLRYAFSDEEIRTALNDELGEVLFEKTASVRKALEKQISDWHSHRAY